MREFINGYANFLNFKGKAKRKEYWMFLFFTIIIILLMYIILGLFYLLDSKDAFDAQLSLFLIFLFFNFIPLIALSIRRLSDAGLQRKWMLAAIIPFYGSIFLLILFIMPTNKYDV